MPDHLMEMIQVEAFKLAQAELEAEEAQKDHASLLKERIARAYPLDQYPQYTSSEEAYRDCIKKNGESTRSDRQF